MANCVHLLADLKSVCDLLLRFWEARNMKSGGNQIGVDLLLLMQKWFRWETHDHQNYFKKIEFTCLGDDLVCLLILVFFCFRICRRLSSKSPSGSWLHLYLRRMLLYLQVKWLLKASVEETRGIKYLRLHIKAVLIHSGNFYSSK